MSTPPMVLVCPECGSDSFYEKCTGTYYVPVGLFIDDNGEAWAEQNDSVETDGEVQGLGCNGCDATFEQQDGKVPYAGLITLSEWLDK